MSTPLIKNLIDFGLSEKEARVYLALFELEVATVNEIAKKTGVNRSSAYVVLESLKKQGFVSTTGNEKVQKFAATTPEMLMRLAEERADKQNKMKEKIKNILPELKSMHKDTKHRPKVYIYEGEEAWKVGFYDVFDEQVKKGMKKFRVYEDLADLKINNEFNFFSSIGEDVKKKGAKMYLISPDTKESLWAVNEYRKHDSKDEFAIIPTNKFKKTTKSVLGLSIYEDKIEFFSRDLFMVIIESKEIADVMKNIFDLAWEESKRLGKLKDESR
jgi:sugar-specific transcriptional regulator TrmB